MTAEPQHYDDVLPNPGVEITPGNTAVVITDPQVDFLSENGVTWHIVPGITSASAAVATIGQSLTRRDRNGSVRFLTGHDMKGFADHDWKTLARPGEVAAIYMGKKSARFIQGRLLMHGAAPSTPVTVVENVSRPERVEVATTLADLPDAMAAGAIGGPAILYLGIAPLTGVAAEPETLEGLRHAQTR